jgi:lipopolysaccharide biosynthesis regulator YciM
VIAAGFWFYKASHAKQVANASNALAEAEQALNAGNLALAQSDLEKLSKRYDNTPSGKEAVLLLAQVLYQKGQYQQGIEQLQKIANADTKYIAAGANSMIAAGYEQQSKYADAASYYQKAADKAAFPTDRDNYRAAAARALASAGKTDEARKIWTDLANDLTSPAAAEARVRLGELDAKKAG